MELKQSWPREDPVLLYLGLDSLIIQLSYHLRPTLSPRQNVVNSSIQQLLTTASPHATKNANYSQPPESTVTGSGSTELLAGGTLR